MDSHRSPTSIPERLQAVRGRITEAADRAGRDVRTITLVAVSKRKPADDVVTAYGAGQRDFGESYIQEFEAKSSLLPPLPEARFHLIGRLQSNKAKRAAGLFTTIHTLDSIRLAKRLDRYEISLDVFLEIKLSEEESKSGMDPTSIDAVMEATESATNLRVVGLMTMPPWNPDSIRSRPYFRQLRKLAERYGLAGLSMGMSHDLEVAIEEGATHVRVGTAIFGARDPVKD